jgi:aspartate racemase
MKTLGILGGMSWESTLVYYRELNRAVQQRLGGHHSASLLLRSFDFAPIEGLQRAGRWDDAAVLLGGAAQQLQQGGAQGLVLATNTMHKLAPELEARVNIPLLHIADATGETIRACGLHRVGLLGTRFTMEQDFYTRRLRDRFDLDVQTPDANDREFVHRVIYDELCKGRIDATSRDGYLAVIDRLVAQGCEGVILGCTEIMLLIDASKLPVPGFDTTALHVQHAVEWMLNGTET